MLYDYTLNSLFDISKKSKNYSLRMEQSMVELPIYICLTLFYHSTAVTSLFMEPDIPFTRDTGYSGTKA